MLRGYEGRDTPRSYETGRTERTGYAPLAYFPDEVAFLAHELIGLTVEEARMLHGGRDRAYLDAPGYLRRAQDDQLGR